MVSFKGSGGAGLGPELPASAAYPKRVQVIRNRNGHLMGFYQRGRTYVVGFPSPMHLKRVREVMGPNSRMLLSNHLPLNVAHDIRYRMRARGLGGRPEGDVDKVTVDVTAHFYLEKRMGAVGRRSGPGGLLEQAAGALAAAAAGGGAGTSAAATWTVTEIPFQEFIMLPFKKNLGIVLPMELLADDNTRIVFESHVVDPLYDPVLFQPTPIR